MAPNGRDAYFWRHDRGRRVAVRQLRHSSPFAVRPAGLAAWRRKYPQAPAQRDRAPAGRDRPALFVCVLRREEPAPDHKGVIAAARQRGRKCARVLIAAQPTVVEVADELDLVADPRAEARPDGGEATDRPVAGVGDPLPRRRQPTGGEPCQK